MSLLGFPDSRFLCKRFTKNNTSEGSARWDRREQIEVQWNFNKGSTDLSREFESWGIPSKLSSLEAATGTQ